MSNIEKGKRGVRDPRLGDTAYVVAWKYKGGGGFDWYYTESSADKEFVTEKKNARDLKADRWTAYRFDVPVLPDETNEQVTNKIDDDFDRLCNRAFEKYRAKTKMYPQLKIHKCCKKGRKAA
jgi:glutathionyl-hydroquinone reductase